MSSRDCCKDGTSRPDFDPKRNFMGQPWLDHEDSTPPLSYLDQASAAPLFGHAPSRRFVFILPCGVFEQLSCQGNTGPSRESKAEVFSSTQSICLVSFL